MALETGLADPESSPALESLVLDLLRAVGDEAEATAKDSALRAQRGAEAMLATAMAQAQAAQLQLENERAQTASLRVEITALKEQLATAVISRQDSDSAHQRECAELAATITELQKTLENVRRASAASADGLASA